MLACLFTLSSLLAQTSDDICEFAIVIPSYNNEAYVLENLESICWQRTKKPYRIYYINDCSSDNTLKKVQNYTKKNNKENMVTIVNNKERIGSGIANIYHTIHNYIEDHKVVVILDGDDLLPNNNILGILEEHYKDPDTWMTYSKLRYIPDSGYTEGEKTEDWVYKNNKVRKHCGWITALRSFRAAFFKKIEKEDLCYRGTFMTVSWDQAFCIPMLEMGAPVDGGKNHCVFIDEVMYIYRINTPLNDYHTRKPLQLEVENYIRSLPPYKPLKKLAYKKASLYQQLKEFYLWLMGC